MEESREADEAAEVVGLNGMRRMRGVVAAAAAAAAAAVVVVVVVVVVVASSCTISEALKCCGALQHARRSQA